MRANVLIYWRQNAQSYDLALSWVSIYLVTVDSMALITKPNLRPKKINEVSSI